MNDRYDIIVVGGGHAGCEAALAGARLGCKVILVTMDIEKIGLMSCNPAIGGIGKGQLVREVDALGGEMGRATDAALIQFRMLNSSKGYAARSSRAQADRKKYNDYMRNIIIGQEGLDVLEDEATAILTGKSTVTGIKTKNHGDISSAAVIITPGTFMNGIIHIGLEHKKGGRIGEESSLSLPMSLKKLGFTMMSLKTGTTPRLDGKTIDFRKTSRQAGDNQVLPFSFWTREIENAGKPCFITRTNRMTHDIIRKNLDRSPLYSGKIKSTGVRYCPSIEDKIVKFSERDSHTVFLEPEGLSTDEYYPNGISTSLPLDTQLEIVHSIEGLEKAEIVRPGYGIEYDIVDPTQLKPTLETKLIRGLFLAGQINGTTGYEEAASLGLMAGINASRMVQKKGAIIIDRSQAYIGVLIDDLVTKGTNEPYRMFTSRVEYRLIVREDNAPMRLGSIGYDIGLVSRERFGEIEKMTRSIETLVSKIRSTRVLPDKGTNAFLREKCREVPIKSPTTLSGLLKRPGISLDHIAGLAGWEERYSYIEKTQAEVSVKYEGYIQRERSLISQFKKIEKISIPEDFDYGVVAGLSSEIKEKLSRFRPHSLGQAARLSGVTPAAITLLMVRLHAAQ